jgi:hypothetical protein
MENITFFCTFTFQYKSSRKHSSVSSREASETTLKRSILLLHTAVLFLHGVVDAIA